MPEDDPLKSLLDGDISSEELEAIRSSPDLRKLAIRMYGESILDLLGEEKLEPIESIESSQDDVLEMVDIILSQFKLFEVQSNLQAERKVNKKVKLSVGLLIRMGLGLSFVGIGLANVYWGFGNILSTCANEIHSTCGVF